MSSPRCVSSPTPTTTGVRGGIAIGQAAFKRDETEHIHGTTSRFVAYRLAELGLALGGAGVATYGVVGHHDLDTGIGLGVAIEALTFFTIDSFGTRRAHPAWNAHRGIFVEPPRIENGNVGLLFDQHGHVGRGQ